MLLDSILTRKSHFYGSIKQTILLLLLLLLSILSYVTVSSKLCLPDQLSVSLVLMLIQTFTCLSHAVYTQIYHKIFSRCRCVFLPSFMVISMFGPRRLFALCCQCLIKKLTFKKIPLYKNTMNLWHPRNSFLPLLTFAQR